MSARGVVTQSVDTFQLGLGIADTRIAKKQCFDSFLETIVNFNVSLVDTIGTFSMKGSCLL
jgi:hypothetical protein